MKRKLFIAASLFSTLIMSAQTFYTFEGDGDWTDVAQWQGGSYPGLTIAADEVVDIIGLVTIAVGTTIENNGTIETFTNSSNELPEMMIEGELNNNNTITFRNAIVNITGTLANEADIDITNSSKITNNSQLTNTGDISILSGVAALTNDGNFINQGTLSNVSGTFTNNSDLDNFSIIENEVNFNNNGSIDNKLGATITTSRSLANEASGDILNSGTIIVTDFSSFFNNNGTTTNNGQITIETSANLNLNSGGMFDNGVNGTITNEGDIKNSDVNTINNGLIINNSDLTNQAEMTNSTTGIIENNGDLSSSFGGILNNNGLLRGINTDQSGNFANNGVLAPGNTSNTFGVYALNGGSYTQTSTASLDIELGGVSAGVDYDQFVIERDAILVGTLNVVLQNGFEPNIGDAFTVLLQGRSISGTFETVNLPMLSAGKAWDDVVYDNTNGVILSVVQGSILSVNDVVKDDIASIFASPNPTNGIVSVEGLNNSEKVIVFNAIGRKMVSSTISKGSNSVDLSGFTAGIYFVNIGESMLKVIKK